MKKLLRFFNISFIAVFVLIGIVLSSCESTEPLFDHYTPNGSYSINWDDLPTTNESKGLKLGGFVGLFYKGQRTFYTVTDRGPVAQKITENGSETYLVNSGYSPRLVELELQDDYSMKVISNVAITNPAQSATTGKIPQNSWVNDEHFTNSENVTDEWGIYPGGIVMDVQNHFFWITDQYQPSLMQMTVNGEWIRRLRPAEGIRKVFENQTVNGGLTGIDYTADGNFVSIMGRTLEHNRNPEDTESEINYSLRRILLTNIKAKSDLSLFYFVEPESYDGIPPRFVTMGDIATINDTSYLVTETASYNGIERNLLFMVSTDENTTKAVVGLEGINEKTFETLEFDEWRFNELFPVNKKLLLDLSEYGISKPDAIEIISDNKIAILDNNQHGIKNADPNAQTYSLDRSPIKLEIINLPTKLELK